MSSYAYRAAFIVAASAVSTARAMNDALGWGPKTYACPLSADGSAPATHYGLSTVATQTARDIIANARNGTVPVGVDAAAAQQVLLLVVDKWGPADTNPGAQFDALCAEVGVQRIVAEI